MKKLVELAHEVRIAIEKTSSNPEIAQTMADYTYNEEKLQAGKDLLEKSLQMEDAQQKEYGEQYDATDQLEKAKEEARNLYVEHLSLARIALKNNRGAWRLLKLTGARKRDTLGWLGQARVFYANAIQVAALLKKFGLSAAEIERGRVMIEAVLEAYSQRKKEMDEACQSTQHKNDAIYELKDWMDGFKNIARVAFKDQPGKLRTLGIRPGTRKRSR